MKQVKSSRRSRILQNYVDAIEDLKIKIKEEQAIQEYDFMRKHQLQGIFFQVLRANNIIEPHVHFKNEGTIFKWIYEMPSNLTMSSFANRVLDMINDVRAKNNAKRKSIHLNTREDNAETLAEKLRNIKDKIEPVEHEKTHEKEREKIHEKIESSTPPHLYEYPNYSNLELLGTITLEENRLDLELMQLNEKSADIVKLIEDIQRKKKEFSDFKNILIELIKKK